MSVIKQVNEVRENEKVKQVEAYMKELLINGNKLANESAKKLNPALLRGETPFWSGWREDTIVLFELDGDRINIDDEVSVTAEFRRSRTDYMKTEVVEATFRQRASILSDQDEMLPNAEAGWHIRCSNFELFIGIRNNEMYINAYRILKNGKTTRIAKNAKEIAATRNKSMRLRLENLAQSIQKRADVIEKTQEINLQVGLVK